MATAMIRCLRKTFPLAQIDMVVRSDFKDLLTHNPHLDRLLPLERKEGFRALWNLRKEINRQHYDLIYDAHRSLRTLFLMPFLQAEQKAYFSKHYFKRTLALLFKWKSLIRGSKRMLERYLDPLLPWGVTYDGGGPELFPSPTSQLQEICKRAGLSSSRRYLGVIPSAQWPGKRWPLERFQKTLQLLVEQTEEVVLIFGGPQDDFCQDLVKGLPTNRVINLQGQLTLLETLEVFPLLKACIANDTGLMHMADALNIPTVLIFGPTHADLGCLPFHPKSQVIEHELWCRPCSKNGQAVCIRSKRWCLELTSPQKVVQTTRQLLSTFSPSL